MLFNYIKLALRSLLKHKAYSLINLFGLVGGVASALVLVLYAVQELTYDSSHQQRDRVFMVYKERKTPTGTIDVFDTWVPTLDAMKSDYADIENGARQLNWQAILTVGTSRFNENVDFVDPALFELFNLPLVNGDGATLLKTKSNLILSRAAAQRLFGAADPIGKQVHALVVGIDMDFVVAGILEDIPINSSLRPDIIIPFENAMDIPAVKEAGWGSSFLSTFVLLKDPATAARLEELFPGLVRKTFDEETVSRMKFKLLSLSDFHNRMSGSDRFSFILLSIALMILVIAVINYINLATVRSIERAREIGMRKVMGASLTTLIQQFLGESFAFTFVAFALSIVMLQFALPLLNSLLDINLSMDVLLSPLMALIILGIFIASSLAAGSFPAFFISRNKTVESIKGKLKSTKVGSGLRRSLIVLQFALSIVLCLATMVIYNQVLFMKNHDLGFNQENVIVIPTDVQNSPNAEGKTNRILAFKNELKQQAGVLGVATSNIVPTNDGWSYTLIRPDDWQEEQPFRIQRAIVDEDYFALYGVDFADGENFTDHMVSSDTSVHGYAIVNEAAMKAFGWNTAEGKRVWPQTFTQGVVRDHHYRNLAQAVEPIVFVYRPVERMNMRFVSVRVNGNPSNLISTIEEKWKTVDPSETFSYWFMDTNFQTLYAAEDRNVRIVTWFSGLSIVIACMGLLGLVSFSVNQRIKEIGIRKVLGSSDLQILFLLNKEYVLLIAISLLLAIPTGYYLMQQWLSDYAVREPLGWIAFVFVAFVTFALAFSTISVRAMTAARMNPVKSLKVE